MVRNGWIGQIKEDIFWQLLDKGEIPRIILVNDRHVKKVWDEMVPTAEMIRADLSDLTGERRY